MMCWTEGLISTVSVSDSVHGKRGKAAHISVLGTQVKQLAEGSSTPFPGAAIYQCALNASHAGNCTF